MLAAAWLAGLTAAVWLVPVEHAGAAVAGTVVAAIVAARGMGRVWPLVFAAAVAWTATQLDFDQSRRVLPDLVGRNVAVRGWVDGFPSVSDGQVAFTLRVAGDGEHAQVPARLRLTWYDPPIEIRPALALDLIVRLKSPRGLVNPGGFDYERWLFVEDIGATGYVRSGGVTAAVDWTVPRRWLEFRAALASQIAARANEPDGRALLIALAIGERFELERSHWRVLRTTGTSHLVAISGLHIGIVATWLFFLVRRLWLRVPMSLAVYDLEVASAVSLLGATLYAAVAGFAVPTQRALIMLCVALVLIVLRRSAASIAALAIALLIVTALDPLAILSGGFWLSFGAVAVLLALAQPPPVARARAAALRRKLAAAIRAQWGITLGLAPIVAFAFGELSLLAPAVNMIAIPIFAVLLVPLVLVTTAALAVGLPGDWLVLVASALADWIYRGLEWLAASGIGPLPLPRPAPVSTALLLVGVAVALPTSALPGRYLGWLAILAALLQQPARPLPGTLRAVVLDVGHGLAVIVMTAEHVLLYDAGARYRSGFDTGRDVVLPAMRSLGVTRLDRVVVSHADNDHAGGLGAILAAYPAAQLLAGRDVWPDRAAGCLAGQHWQWDGVRFEVLHPAPDMADAGNDGSCVIRVDTADGSLLLTGDIELHGERRLLALDTSLAADVVVVPHHGSATSSSEPFVDAVDARVAIVSAGFENRWGFPRPEVTARWRRAGARVVTTGSDGAIDIALGAGAAHAHAARERWQRPWMAPR